MRPRRPGRVSIGRALRVRANHFKVLFRGQFPRTDAHVHVQVISGAVERERTSLGWRTQVLCNLQQAHHYDVVRSLSIAALTARDE